MLGDELTPEVLFGRQGIVSRAAQGQICSHIGPIFRKWLQVVKLEIVRLVAALTAGVDIRASRFIAPVHLATLGRRDVAGARGVGLEP